MDLIDYLGLLCVYSKAQGNTLSPVRSGVLTSVDSCPCRTLLGGRKSLLREGTPSETLPVCKLPILVSPIKKLKTLLTSVPGLCSTKYSTFFYFNHLFPHIRAPLPATVAQLLW